MDIVSKHDIGMYVLIGMVGVSSCFLTPTIHDKMVLKRMAFEQLVLFLCIMLTL